MVKLIAIDLDGTLLKDDKSVSASSLATLEKCRARGIKIAAATSRSGISAARYLGLFNPDFMILNGGALAIRKNGEILYEKLLSTESSDGIAGACAIDKNAGDITVETKRGYYVSYKEPADHPDYAYGEYWDFSKPLAQEAYKLTIEIFDGKTAVRIGGRFPECQMTAFSGEAWHRFAHREAEKMAAIRAVSERENIKIDEIAAFGDDYIDLEMLRGCGIGVAMENGAGEIKAAADYVCGSNNDDGVAKWIEAHILD